MSSTGTLGRFVLYISKLWGVGGGGREASGVSSLLELFKLNNPTVPCNSCIMLYNLQLIIVLKKPNSCLDLFYYLVLCLCLAGFFYCCFLYCIFNVVFLDTQTGYSNWCKDLITHYIHIHTNTHIWTHRHTNIYIHVCTYNCQNTNTYVNTQSYTSIHSYANKHKHSWRLPWIYWIKHFSVLFCSVVLFSSL